MKQEEKGVHFREITKENLTSILDLKVAPHQETFVAPNAVSIAQAHYYDYAWFRAIYNGEEPIGFIMLGDPDSDVDNKYFLWRFMIAAPYQGHGYGKQALDLAVDYLRTRPNAHYFYTSYHPGEGSPKNFYLKYGFEPTGEMVGNEVELKLKL